MCKSKEDTKTIYWQCVDTAKIDIKSRKNFGAIFGYLLCKAVIYVLHRKREWKNQILEKNVKQFVFRDRL